MIKKKKYIYIYILTNIILIILNITVDQVGMLTIFLHGPHTCG